MQRADDPALAVIAHHALGNTWLCLGALPAARQHLEEAIAHYTPDQRRAPVFRIGHDSGVACRAFAGWTLWLLGYPAQALAHIDDALVLAQALLQYQQDKLPIDYIEKRNAIVDAVTLDDVKSAAKRLWGHGLLTVVVGRAPQAAAQPSAPVTKSN